MKYLYSILSFGLAVLPQQSHAQRGPCPLLGPVFPPVRDPLSSSSFADTMDRLNNTFHEFGRNGTFQGLNATFYVQAFSASETLFQHGYVPPEMKGFLTSQTLNEDTVFRIGSVSKLITVYTLLAEVGMERMHDPVTRWVPELARAAKKNKGDPARRVQWDEVTIGQLCGHMAGISRNLGLFDIATFIGPSNANPEQYGLPVLDDKEKPRCSIAEPSLGPCSRKEFFQGLTAQTNFPITSTSNTPVYSNLAYQILAYALEGMTGNSFEKSLESSLLRPLSMKRTTLEAPKSKKNAIIPENDLLSWWNITTGDSSPYGGIFSTAADLTRLGQSILNSSILHPSTTRSWLKPMTHTADLHLSVGMPWEIRRALLPLGHRGTRVVDLYTKNGAFGLYSAMIVLSPDHELGYVVLLAGSGSDKLLGYLPDLLAETLLPAAEYAARETAAARFAGVYQGTSNKLTVEMNQTLVVRNWTRGGIDVLSTHASFIWPGSGVEPVLRLYPMGLEDDRTMSFRGIYEAKAVEESEAKAREGATEAPAGPFSGGCLSWGLVDMLTYGNVGSDDFEFEIDQRGKVTGLRPRMMRETLKKVD
ncbi:beta-lactamase/transpeptidase-like protein [Chaetomium strumarium]|uniref:Beta-lactamase/transpeptidase-like protein n=1 Tax=Chaetomium strumarium TaxID=1170767 RepID=A0AAJ0M4C1_9PEZI|nr:beta-lactamase/transpeptidase-like protein [Chaetomium strumarium]